jgi:transcriptional regulator with XRE-family HTH domain
MLSRNALWAPTISGMGRGKIGPILHKALRASGRQQKEVALKLGMKPQVLNKILRGRVQDPGFETVWRIADELGVDFTKLTDEARQAALDVMPVDVAEIARPADSKFQLFEIPPEEFIVGEWDYPQTYRGGEADLMGGAAAGAFLDVDVTGETAELLNPTLRDVQSGRYGVVKIFGDSMEPRLHNGDLVLLDTFDKEYRPERIMAVYRRRSATERGGGAFGYVHKVGELLIMTKANPRYGPIILTDQDIIRGVVKKRLSEDLE